MFQQQKRAIKNTLKKEGNKSFGLLVLCMIASVLNWVFWHDQFLCLDTKYTLVFIALPLVLGILLYYFMNKAFVKNLFATKASSWWDRILSAAFLIMTALFFGFVSMVTLANVVFKISMDLCIKEKPFAYKTYTVTSTYKNNIGNRIHLFSSVYYLDENSKAQIFEVGVDAVETSGEKRKITFPCKKGFWGYYKIVGYRID
ncbi:MAG: hypothetical protein QM783_20995 [Phycisphaerales bacterium]